MPPFSGEVFTYSSTEVVPLSQDSHLCAVFVGAWRCTRCTTYVLRIACPQPDEVCAVCSVLGMGLLHAVDYAAERLLKPGAVVLPARVHVSALSP